MQDMKKIDFEDKEELIRQWNNIGENDCNLPPDYLTELFHKILDHVSEKEKVNCGCYEWDEELEDMVEPNSQCKKCKGIGWYHRN